MLTESYLSPRLMAENNKHRHHHSNLIHSTSATGAHGSPKSSSASPQLTKKEQPVGSGKCPSGVPLPDPSDPDWPKQHRVPLGQKLFTAFSAIYWLLTTGVFVPTICIFVYYILLLPVALLKLGSQNIHRMYLWIERQVAKWANEHWVAAFHWYGIGVLEYGDNVDDVADERAILMANHCGLIDHFILMASLHEKGTITERVVVALQCMWLIFHIWQMTPLGYAWMLHGNYFINGGADKRVKQLSEFRDHLRARYWRDDHSWIVVYPEGSRLFLIKDSNQRYAERTGAPQLRHMALPRTGAIGAMLQECGPRAHRNGVACSPAHCPPTCHSPLKYIIDATLGYPNDYVASMDQVVGGELSRPDRPYTVAVHYRIFPIAEVPFNDERALRDWMYARWIEKDRLLDDFFRTGHFPQPRKRVNWSLWRTLAVECVWALHWYVHWRLWVKTLLVWVGGLLF